MIRLIVRIIARLYAWFFFIICGAGLAIAGLAYFNLTSSGANAAHPLVAVGLENMMMLLGGMVIGTFFLGRCGRRLWGRRIASFKLFIVSAAFLVAHYFATLWNDELVALMADVPSNQADILTGQIYHAGMFNGISGYGVGIVVVMSLLFIIVGFKDADRRRGR